MDHDALGTEGGGRPQRLHGRDRSGGRELLADSCPAISRVTPPVTPVFATDSAKQAHYLPAIRGIEASAGPPIPAGRHISAATVILATEVAAAILHSDPALAHVSLPTSVTGVGVVAAAGAVRWALNYLLVVGAIVVSSPRIRARQLLHNIDERILEAGALGLGLCAAGFAVYNPYLLIGVVLGLVAMHRGTLLPQLRQAATTDAKTGLLVHEWWRELATSTFEKAQAAGGSLAALIIDLDHFKHVNDHYGHVAGDTALRAVADVIGDEVRAGDHPARWGGEEFAILLPGLTSTADLRLVADRIRRRVSSLVVTVRTPTGESTISDLTVSIGGATYPAPQVDTLDDLVLAADAALYQAKAAGRDRVFMDDPAGSAS